MLTLVCRYSRAFFLSFFFLSFFLSSFFLSFFFFFSSSFFSCSFFFFFSLGRENAKDIVAFGFDPNKTFIFSNRDYRMDRSSGYEEFVSTLTKNVQLHTVKKIFGFEDSKANIGMAMWPVYQSAGQLTIA